MKKIGFIGLGIMGNAMAANLQKADYELTVHNRSKEKADTLLRIGASWADTPKEVGQRAETVISMLSGPEVISKCALGPSGFLSGMKKGSIWMNCSTVNPSYSRDLASICQKKEIRYIDAPVAGTRGPAERGELIFLVGASSEDLESVAPLLAVMGKKTMHLGDIGFGSGMKMLINLLLGQSLLAFAEALCLGKEMGFREEMLLDTLLQLPVTAPFLGRIRPKLETKDYSPNFPLKWMQKDLQLASTTAYEHQLALPSLNIAKEIYALARQNGYAVKDFSAIYDYLGAKQ